MQYLPLVALAVLGFLFASISFVVNGLLAPKRPNDKKNSAYECGIEPAKETPERFPVRFFLIAMIFIVFDIELIFFYPWAVSHASLGSFGLVALLIFAFAVFESFVYLIGNGALEWGPVHQAQRLKAAVSGERTTRSTIRRVGGEGRLTDEAA
ncbi:MAG: NADH-quinone oxidoreductase subunit A [Acidimicrobiia bacterium]|nr:NADH-quinone oxidoreductase subunit A [Acidimicrobiia bacterium]